MFNKFIVNENNTIREALVVLNNVSGEAQSLFIIDDKQQMVGSLSDGDIRRGIINGGNLEDKVETIMHRDFKYLEETDYDVAHVKEFRERRIHFIPILDEGRHIIDVVNLQKCKSRLPVDAVLMAGGKGERLRPLTEKTPKPLLEMNGKPIIDYILEHIISYGIKNISVTVNYLKEQIEDHLASTFRGIQVKTVREPKFLGTIGGISYVNDFHHDTVLLMNSDAITDINLEDFYLHFLENNADMSVAAIPYIVSIPYGILNLDGKKVKSVLEKPTYSYYINSGIYLIRRGLLSLIPQNEFFNATDFIELLISKKYNVVRYPLNGTWIDIGNKEDYKKAKEFISHLRW